MAVTSEEVSPSVDGGLKLYLKGSAPSPEATERIFIVLKTFGNTRKASSCYLQDPSRLFSPLPGVHHAVLQAQRLCAAACGVDVVGGGAYGHGPPAGSCCPTEASWADVGVGVAAGGAAGDGLTHGASGGNPWQGRHLHHLHIRLLCPLRHEHCYCQVLRHQDERRDQGFAGHVPRTLYARILYQTG
ncbi:uncharacterized protein [Panulirus ornatus]|uniref:uncharacterized protein isoform X1 n=1 Tax=Panulirus ornatus TaxID=150431 RepID=UPI003A87BCF6